MPVRILRPTLRTSERWHRLKYFERCFYISLLNLVDDYGRYEAHPQLLSSECFPYGDENGMAVTCQAIDGGLRSLASKDLIVVYECDGKRVLQMTRWKERVRTESKFKPAEQGKIVYSCDNASPDKPAQFKSLETIHLEKIGQNQSVTDKCQSFDGQLHASPPTPTPTPTPTPVAKTLQAAVAAPALSDSEWLASLKTNSAYHGIDVDREYSKMTVWCQTNRKQPTRRRFINWLNRAEKPMASGPVRPAANPNAPTKSEVHAKCKEKWGDDERWATWATSFYAHWNDPKRNWKRNDKSIDWQVELSQQVARWKQ